VLSTSTEYDLQVDAVTIAAIYVESHRAVASLLVRLYETLWMEPRRHCERFARGQISGCQREVLLWPSLTLRRVDSRLPKGYDSALPVEWRRCVCRMPKVPPKSPHARDRVGSQRSTYCPTPEGA